MAVTTLKVLASVLQLHGPGATIQSDHQGIDALLSDLQNPTNLQQPRSISDEALSAAPRAGAFRRAGILSRCGRIPQRRIYSRILDPISLLHQVDRGAAMSADDSDSATFQDQPITQLLVKVATRCNIDCSYCYWFRDAAVYNKPKLMSADVLHQLLQRIEQHVARYSLVDFPIILHGGEPLLWGVENFHRFAEACEGISSRTGCEIPVAVTTNGVLIDDEWLDCFETRNISVAISIDGPAHIHDIHRRTFQGTGTHAAVERAARMLVSRDIGVSALAVCQPAYPPEHYVAFFAACGISNYDIMIPDATVDERPPSIAAFYKGLFDLWLAANRRAPTANIRIISDMITALLGNNSPTEGVGHKPVELCTVMTDGTVEAHDVLRIAGDGFTRPSSTSSSTRSTRSGTSPAGKPRAMLRSTFARSADSASS